MRPRSKAEEVLFGEDLQRARGPIRVLVAEDDQEMRRLIISALRKDGCEVVQAEDGARFVESIVTRLLAPIDEPPIDVIVSDHRMPGFSGLEVLAALRKQHWSTPFVLITAFGDAETHAEAQRLGASAVLNKPFDLDDLRIVVNCFGAQN
jgi:CheY-like chemotaxis protein